MQTFTKNIDQSAWSGNNNLEKKKVTELSENLCNFVKRHIVVPQQAVLWPISASVTQQFVQTVL